MRYRWTHLERLHGPRGNEFSGEVNGVQIDLGLDDHDHLISPEQRLSFAMARQ